MNPEEIANHHPRHCSYEGPTATNFWLREIALQLALINRSIERLSDPTSFKVHEQALRGPAPVAHPNPEQGEDITDLNPTNNPPKAKAVVQADADLKIVDNGKGVLFTVQLQLSSFPGYGITVNQWFVSPFTFWQKGGQPIGLPPNTPPAVINVSSPALTVVPDPGDPSATPPRPADTTGLVFLGTITQPPQDVDGVVATFAYTFPDGVQLTATADPVDITPSETDPDSFVIQESAL